MFVERLISGIILMIITIATLIAGGYCMFAVITAVTVIGLYELYRTVQLEKSLPAVIGYLAGIGIELCICLGYEKYLELICLLALILFMAVYVITYPKYVINQVTYLFFGIIYVALMLSFVCRVREMESGAYLVWLIFIGAWGSDTCAYCVGKLIGKHKLPSKLSPKKTIEGCVGGIIGAALIGAIYGMIFREQVSITANPVAGFAVIGAVSAVISQIGDLAASGIKRNYDIKDYGKLIPGHGGILDRFDSIIFIAPIVYYLITCL